MQKQADPYVDTDKNKIPLLVIGGGGHSKVVIDALQDAPYEIIGIIERDVTQVGKQVCGISVIATDSEIPALFNQSVRHAIIAIGHLGHNDIRNQIARRLHACGFQLAKAIHPTAIVSQNAKIGEGTVICAGAVINPGATIGQNCIINTACVIEHDVILGNNVHVAPNAAIAGGTTVGDNAFLGMGSCVIQNLHLDVGCIVGAGSVVLHDVGAGETVVGIPAKRI